MVSPRFLLARGRHTWERLAWYNIFSCMMCEIICCFGCLPCLKLEEEAEDEAFQAADLKAVLSATLNVH
jgi:hypothetical protein